MATKKINDVDTVETMSATNGYTVPVMDQNDLDSDGDPVLKQIQLDKIKEKFEAEGHYLTEHQDISGKADKASTLAGYGITDAYTKTEVDSRLTSAMHYKGTVETVADLENIASPETGDVYNVTSTGDNYAYDGTSWDKLSGVVDLSAYVRNSDLAPVARSGSYNDLSDKPTIPSKTSDLQNDSGFLTQHQDISGKADRSELPTKTSDLQNDSGFLTQHQDISGKANTADLAPVATSGSYNDLSDKPTIPVVPESVTKEWTDIQFLKIAKQGEAGGDWRYPPAGTSTYFENSAGSVAPIQQSCNTGTSVMGIICFKLLLPAGKTKLHLELYGASSASSTKIAIWRKRTTAALTPQPYYSLYDNYDANTGNPSKGSESSGEGIDGSYMTVTNALQKFIREFTYEASNTPSIVWVGFALGDNESTSTKVIFPVGRYYAE